MWNKPDKKQGICISREVMATYVNIYKKYQITFSKRKINLHYINLQTNCGLDPYSPEMN